VTVPVAAADKTRRVQMELSATSFERLNRLKEMAEASSYTEVMKDALRLYEYFLQKDAEGAQFQVKSKNGEISEIKIFA
jgi:IS1 family transposase